MDVKEIVAKVCCLTNRNYPTLANCQIYIIPHPTFEFHLVGGVVPEKWFKTFLNIRVLPEALSPLKIQCVASH